MTTQQIASRGITDIRVLDAMRETPRHLFVPLDVREAAYEDHPLRIGAGQTISQPYMVGVMTALLAPGPMDHVLEIGTGSGYQTAVLARLCREVDTIERIHALADAARERLQALGIRNVKVHTGDGSLGWPNGAPYDGILVTAAAPGVPESLKAQLAPGGRLICPTGSRHSQLLVRIRRLPEGYMEDTHTPCVFVPLIGGEGWPEDVGE